MYTNIHKHTIKYYAHKTIKSEKFIKLILLVNVITSFFLINKIVPKIDNFNKASQFNLHNMLNKSNPIDFDLESNLELESESARNGILKQNQTHSANP